jgi:hypothetical protein
MTRKSIGLALVLSVLAFISSGCYRAARLERMGYEILDACPDARFKKEFSLSLGGVSWGIIKSIAKAAEKDDPDMAYIDDLSRIELVVYKARGLSKEDARPIGEIMRDRLDDNWDLMVKTAEDDDLAWVHYREDDGHIRELQIVAYDGEEFVIVRLSGRLDEMMEMAVEDHGGFTDKIVHSARD